MGNESKDIKYVENDEIADYFMREFIDKEYLAWAIVDYLSKKTLLDFDDFKQHLKKSCSDHVSIIKKVME